jgi:lipooligosaccharide transport system permease protein
VAPPVLRVLEHNALVYRRTFRGTLFTTFLSPVLFLTAMGLGLGALVDRQGGAQLGGVSYLAFLAPGLLAASAMQTGAFENTFPVMAKTTWWKTYDAMLATPLRVRDLVLGDLGWSAIRLTISATAFVAVMMLFGAIAPAGALFALPAAVLTGMAFACPIFAFSATQKKDNAFSVLFRFIITPLFLFSGTFFPIEQLPDVIEPVAWVTPLYHGVALTRGLALGTLDPAAGAIHLAVLLAFIGGGLALAFLALRRRMVT